MGRRVAGVGINDSETPVLRSEKGKVVWKCPYYTKWASMLNRCYNPKFHSASSYKDCHVCPEWLLFSNFRLWMQGCSWEGRQLDKDLLKTDNKEYCPEFCVFLDKTTNTFLTDSLKVRGDYKQGVVLHTDGGRLVASCGNPFVKHKNDYIGCFHDEDEAHEAWRQQKEIYANMLADLQKDDRIATALRLRFSKEEWYSE